MAACPIKPLPTVPQDGVTADASNYGDVQKQIAVTQFL